jgi:hypothetical protein
VLEILDELGASFGLPLPAFDVAEQDHPPVGQHGQRVAEGVDLLRVKLGCGSLVEVEIAKRGVERPVYDGPDGFVLQDVLGSVEVIDWRQLALGE